MEYKQTSMEYTIEAINDLQQISNDANLGVKCWSLYQTLYEGHKNKYGSNKKHLNMLNYEEKMTERYDAALGCINETIEDLLDNPFRDIKYNGA